MKSRLNQVKDWQEVAKQARFQHQQMARILEVSERNLRRYIWDRFKSCPKQWLDQLRADAAREEIARGEMVKAASSDVAFTHASNFTRFFKRVTGSTPQNVIYAVPMAEIDNQCPE